MDEEMEETYDYAFTAVEIDFDYEFEAPIFFDFCLEETPSEARDAELWFDSAGSYPPSPFAAKLVPRVDVLLENVNTSPKSRNGDDMNLSETDSEVDLNEDVSTMDVKSSYDEAKERETSINIEASNIQKVQNHIQKIRSGLTFYNRMIEDNSRTKTKASVKPSFPRSSTLMKPTASQLAKQNKPQQRGGLRFQKSLFDKNQKSSGNHCLIEVQAPKRQKLEGGLLCKVGDMKQQTHLVHKEPKKDGTGDTNNLQAKLRITIPREPDLETAHRAQAQRMRSKTSNKAENVNSTFSRFKARPLNRKIFEAPSLLLPKRSTPHLPEFQEFHLRTLERAAQHVPTTSTSTIPCSNSNKELHKWRANSTAESGNIESRRPKHVDSSKEEGFESSHTFKALPLNKKIFTSKGDIGVFRNTKRETTVPKEFKFQTEKRVHHNPPIELFNKLSLASDPQPSAGSQLKPPWSTCSAKVLKENRWDLVSKANEVKHVVKEKLLWSGGKQNQSTSSDGRATEVGPASRNLGIR